MTKRKSSTPQRKQPATKIQIVNRILAVIVLGFIFFFRPVQVIQQTVQAVSADGETIQVVLDLQVTGHPFSRPNRRRHRNAKPMRGHIYVDGERWTSYLDYDRRYGVRRTFGRSVGTASFMGERLSGVTDHPLVLGGRYTPTILLHYTDNTIVNGNLQVTGISLRDPSASDFLVSHIKFYIQ